MYCTECFKEQRSINDQKKQAQIDAEKQAETEQKSVAIIQEGYGFRIESFTGAPPGGAIAVVNPMQRS